MASVSRFLLLVLLRFAFIWISSSGFHARATGGARLFKYPFGNRDFKVAFRVPMRDLFWVLALDWDH
jgi:hypothetical protein